MLDGGSESAMTLDAVRYREQQAIRINEARVRENPQSGEVFIAFSGFGH
jgi:hypothetical protein